MRYLLSILLAVCGTFLTPDVGYSFPDIDQYDLITSCDQVHEMTVADHTGLEFSFDAEDHTIYRADFLITSGAQSPPIVHKHIERLCRVIIEASKVRHKAIPTRTKRRTNAGYIPTCTGPPLIRLIG